MQASSPEQKIKELTRLVEAGVSFSDAMAQIAPPPSWHAPVMRRAAFVRVFDRPMFDKVLSDGISGADFESFVAAPGVERTHMLAANPIYRVKDATAVEQLGIWHSTAAREIPEFSRSVLQYLEKNSAAESELLRFLIPVDPVKALELFDRLFDKYDTAFELAQCHALVQTLREMDNFEFGGHSVPLRFLSRELRERLDARVPYIAGRGRFIEEYSKSAKFHERRGITDPTMAFMDQGRPSMLAIHGRGGAGKTMFLRWLIARHCLPRPQCIPVAKVDFDEINIGKLEEFPELVLVSFAEQLNRQITGSPFSEYLQTFSRFASILVPPARLLAEVKLDGLESELASKPDLRSRMISNFSNALSRQSILILDTVEEGVLHFQASLRGVIDCLRSACARNTSLKVILSGRYNLEERGFVAQGECASIEVTPFTDDEAHEFLRRTLKLETSDEIQKEIVHKARGNPFIMSLIADLVVAGSVATIQEVRKLEPEFAYLIQRVIDRIPDQKRVIRWIVRYGVVPRRLTRGFLDNVMAPHLLRELASAHDGQLDEIQKYAGSFRREGTFDLDAVWAELQQYADGSGWLRATPDDVRFQPEVVRPMRALLQQEKIYKQLHAGAVAWFAGQAERAADPEAWVRNTAEELYHRLITDDGEAERRLNEALADRRAQLIERRGALIEFVTDLMASGEDDPGGSERLPAPDALVGQAYLELAKVRAGIGFGSVPAPGSVSEINSFLQRARRINPQLDDRLVQLALAVSDKKFDQAIAIGESVRPGWFPAGDDYAFNVLMGRAHAGVGRAEAEGYYSRACTILDENREPYPKSRVWAECGDALARIGASGRAMAVYHLALQIAGERSEFIGLMAAIAELHVACGEYAAALKILGDDPATGKRGPESVSSDMGAYVDPDIDAALSFRLTRVRFECAIGQLRLMDASALAESLKPDRTFLGQMAQAEEALGIASAALFDIHGAEPRFERAISLYQQIGATAQANGVLLRLLRLLKDQAGDLRRAARVASRIRPTAGESHSTLELPDLWLTLHQWRPHTHGASQVDQLEASAFKLVSPARDKRDARDLGLFLRALGEIEPPSARYRYLYFFAWLPVIPAASHLNTLMQAVVPVPDARDPDFCAKVFGSIELLRCMGLGLAQGLLESTYHLSNRAFSLHRSIAAAERLGAELPPVDMVQRECADLQDRSLAMATLVGFERAWLRRGGHKYAPLVSEDDTIPRGLEGTAIEASYWEILADRRDISSSRSRSTAARAAKIRQQLGQPPVAAAQSVDVSVQAPVTVAKAARRGAATATASSSAAASASATATASEPASANESASATESASVPAPEPTPAPAPAAHEELSRSDGRCTIRLRSARLPWLIGASSEVVPYELADKLARTPPEQVLEMLRAAMSAAHPVNPAPQQDVEFDIDEAVLAMLPWEWLFASEHTCFRSDSALRERGGHPFQFIVRQLPQRLRQLIGMLMPLRMVIMRPPVFEQERLGRGFEIASRRSLLQIYQNYSIKAVEPEVYSIDALRSLVNKSQPRAVHIQAAVSERSGKLVLDLPCDEVLTPENLARQFATQLEWEAPIVVLDPPRPQDAAEVARQLLLRNRFAEELVATNKVQAVLCVGLMEPSTVELAAERLAHALSGRARYQELILLFHRQLPGDPFSTRGAALFARNPRNVLL